MERIEEYLEAILDVQEREKRVARTSDIAKKLNVRPSSVTEMFAKLKEMGYVDYIPYKGVILTEDGRKIAEKIKKYYRVFEKFFRLLGIDEEKAKELSCEMEHHADEKVIEKICPIISGVCNICESCKVKEITLSNAQRGKFVVLAVPSSLKHIIKIDECIEVVENNDTVKIRVDNEIIDLSKEFAKKIVVRRC